MLQPLNLKVCVNTLIQDSYISIKRFKTDTFILPIFYHLKTFITDTAAVPAVNEQPILQDEWGNDGYYDEYTGN